MGRKRKLVSLNTQMLIGVKNVTCGVIRAVVAALPPEFLTDEQKKSLRYTVDVGDFLDEDLAFHIDLPMDDGTTFNWTIARPQAVLRRFCRESEAFRRIMSRRANSWRQPWHIVHYTDDVSSGNLLAPNQSRKFAVFRFAFREYGQQILSCPQFWLEYGRAPSNTTTTTATATRPSNANSSEGGEGGPGPSWATQGSA